MKMKKRPLLFFLFTRFSSYGTTGATGASRNFFSNFDFSYLCSLLPTYICVFTCINVFQSSLIYSRKRAHNFMLEFFFSSKKSIIVEFLSSFSKNPEIIDQVFFVDRQQMSTYYITYLG